MAIIESTRPVPFGAVATLNVVGIFDTVIAGVQQWNATRKTNKILNGLTISQLDDIGIVASNFNTISNTMATRRFV